MSSRTISSQVLVPDYINPPYLFEGLDFGETLLTRHVRKRANPGTQPGMIPKLSSTLVVQMLGKTSAVGAQDILKGEQEDILAFSQAILALPDPIASLEEVVKVLSSDNAPSIFGASPPTVSAHLDRFPMVKADAVLREQLDAIQAKLKAQDLWPGEVMLTADPTDTPYRGRYHNQWTSWGRVGNQPTYKRVYKEFGIFAMPVHLQLGFAPLPVNNKGEAQLPAWVRNLGFALAWVSSTGTRAPLVAVDREFYTAIGFGAAYLSLIAPSLAPEVQPRLLCPTRHWHSKRDPKWEFLAGENSATVAEDTMALNAQDAKLLGPAASRLATGDNGKRLVPVVVIAAFDTYSKRKEPKSLEWARGEATRLNNSQMCL